MRHLEDFVGERKPVWGMQGMPVSWKSVGTTGRGGQNAGRRRKATFSERRNRRYSFIVMLPLSAFDSPSP